MADVLLQVPEGQQPIGEYDTSQGRACNGPPVIAPSKQFENISTTFVEYR